MPESVGALHWDGDDLVLRLRVQPRAARDEFAGMVGDRLKLRISAPPVDGKANQHIAQFLADSFGVPKSRVAIEAGLTSRDKRVRIRAPGKIPDLPTLG